MASEQIHLEKEKDTSAVTAIHVEKDYVPKMTSHYETLAEKAKDPAIIIIGGKDPLPQDTSRRTVENQEGHEKSKEATTDRAAEKGGQARDKAVKGASGTAKHVAEKGSAAKDAVVEKGKEGYKAVKDTVVKAKDYAADAGRKVTEIAVKPLMAVKDAAEAVGDRVKESTAAKTEQTERERQNEGRSDQKGSNTMDEIWQEDADHQDKENIGMRNHGKQGRFGGILGAIGEALVEIARSTKDMVLGKNHYSGGTAGEKNVVYDLGYGKWPEHERGKGDKNAVHESGCADPPGHEHGKVQ